MQVEAGDYVKEIWKDIRGYEGLYQVSNLGRVKSLAWPCHHKKSKILKPFNNGRGYSVVCLYTVDAKKKVKKFLVHRLVADAFIPNPNKKTDVNHKSGIKTDNSVSNLEWATKSENMRHASYTLNAGRHKQRVLCIETGLEFNSVREAGRKTSINYSNIIFAAHGKYKKAGGYHWKYIS